MWHLMEWKLKSPLLISGFIPGCIFSTIFQMLMKEAERLIQSNSFFCCIYAWTHKLKSVFIWEAAGALLGTRITISVKTNVQQSFLLPILSFTNYHPRPDEDWCKTVFFASCHVWWLMAAQSGPPLNNRLKLLNEKTKVGGFFRVQWTLNHSQA